MMNDWLDIARRYFNHRPKAPTRPGALGPRLGRRGFLSAGLAATVTAAISMHAKAQSPAPPTSFVYAPALDNLSVQTAVNTATTLAGTSGYVGVVLPAGNGTWTSQVTYNPALVTIIGATNSGTAATNIYTQALGTTPALACAGGATFTNLYGKCVLSGVNFFGLTTPYNYPGNNGGTAVAANTGYIAGSSAFQISYADSGVVRNCFFQNYDQPHSWAGSNVYIWAFEDCFYYSNNWGRSIPSSPPSNSFENMRWVRGGSSNNNYGHYFVPGAIGGSIFIEGGSCDYNIVNHFYIDTMGGGNDCQLPVYFQSAHIETGSTCSGTGPRGYANCELFILGCKLDEEGPSVPAYYITPGFYSRIHIANSIIPGTGGTATAMVGGSGSQVENLPTGGGNSNRYGYPFALFSGQLGVLMDPGTPIGYSGIPEVKTTSYTLALNDQPFTQYCSGGITVTLPYAASSAAAHFQGVFIKFVTTDSSLITISLGSGVTCTGPLTFGGIAGAVYYLTTTAINTWQSSREPTTAGTATAASGAATLNTQTGLVTSESLTGATSYTLTLTNGLITSSSLVNAWVENKAITGMTITPGSGSVAVAVTMTSFTGALKFGYQVLS